MPWALASGSSCCRLGTSNVEPRQRRREQVSAPREENPTGQGQIESTNPQRRRLEPPASAQKTYPNRLREQHLDLSTAVERETRCMLDVVVVAAVFFQEYARLACHVGCRG
jgi:hypothetical protein